MNGILAVEKPSGVSSSAVVQQIKTIFDQSNVFAPDLKAMREKVRVELTQGTKWLASKIANRVRKTQIKVGHGGTLDPLASGVLIIGVGTGTKQLSYYLGECTKTYETRAMLGQLTTTGDSEGEVVTQTEYSHVTLDSLRHAAAKFVGKIKQTPPIYSALKVDGKPLYEYARQGIPVPKAIEPREVKVHLIEVHDDFGPSDKYSALKCSSEGDSMGNAVFNNPTLNDHELCYSEEFMGNAEVKEEEKTTSVHPKLVDPKLPFTEHPPVFHATATVGSGTYIRSLVSDLGRAVGLLAHMVELVRSKQANWELGKNVFRISDFTDRDEKVWGPVLKTVLDNGESIDVAEEMRKQEALVGENTTTETEKKTEKMTEKKAGQDDEKVFGLDGKEGHDAETKRRKIE